MACFLLCPRATHLRRAAPVFRSEPFHLSRGFLCCHGSLWELFQGSAHIWGKDLSQLNLNADLRVIGDRRTERQRKILKPDYNYIKVISISHLFRNSFFSQTLQSFALFQIQVVEHLPCKCEALSSNPSTTIKKKKKENWQVSSESNLKHYSSSLFSKCCFLLQLL
jgi:hypothetical protein